MKNWTLVLLVSGCFVVASCVGTKYVMGEKEIAEKGYSIKGWEVLKNDTVVGHLRAMEWEIYRNRITREISISTSFSTDEEMKDIARYVHSKFPDCKIEVNEDDGNSFPKE